MKKFCDDHLPALVDAAEGRLTPEFETHLESCEGCQAELGELTASLEAIAPPGAPEPGPWLAPKIRAHHEASAPRVRLLRWALPALVPVALIITVLWTGPSSDGHRLDLGSLDTLEAELARLDPAEIESVLASLQGGSDTDSDFGGSFTDPDDSVIALAAALSGTDEEILDMVLAETSFGYEDLSFDDTGALDEGLELILEAIPG